MKAGLTINVCMSICDIDSYQVFVMLILQQFELICFRISLLKFYAASTRQLQFGNPASQNHFNRTKNIFLPLIICMDVDGREGECVQDVEEDVGGGVGGVVARA